jgi:hypothetical protein
MTPGHGWDAALVGHDGILRACWQPALRGDSEESEGGLPTRCRLPTCPTAIAVTSLARVLQ